MSFQENGLDIIIFPPGGEQIAPNGKTQTRVNITNKKHSAGIRLKVSLDLKAELQKWCKNPSHKITIGYLKSQEIDFLWDIPLQAAPGTYDYNLRIEFLRSTSFYSFKPKRRQLTILRTRVKPQINNIEPSFAITPASSSTKPITLSSRETSNLEIDVHNRSNKTDNFRISTDLEDAWYIIRYPETIKRVGAIDGINALNLNPGEKGKIYLSIYPPADTVAGNYKPEIKLHSLNSPELFLKKIVYLNIPPQYLLQAELQTILNKVSYKKGQYKIIITNLGNTFRTVTLKAKTSDEDECCEYFFEKASVRLLPNKPVEIKLEVQPNSKQKRPFLTTNQFNFQIDLTDRNNYPLPKNLPLKASLFWRSRPLWQSILLFLLALGFIGITGFLIWRLIFPKRLDPKITLNLEQPKHYYDGEPISIEWTLENSKSIDKIIIFDQERKKDLINSKCYVFKQELEKDNCYLITKFINSNNNTPDNSYGKCTSNNNIISCTRVAFNYAKNVKQYNFQIQALARGEKVIDEQKIDTEILPRTTFSVIEPIIISPSQSVYKPTDKIEIKFKVSNFNSLKQQDKISLLINDEVKAVINSQSKAKYCSPLNNSDRYNCMVKISPLTEGDYNLRIETEYDPDGLTETKSQTISAPKQIIVKTPIRKKYFRVNDRDSSITVKADTKVTISWWVTGNNIEVSLGECGNGPFGNKGTKRLFVPEKQTYTCELTASDTNGNQFKLGIIKITGEAKPELELLPPPPPPPVIQPNFNNFP